MKYMKISFTNRYHHYPIYLVPGAYLTKMLVVKTAMEVWMMIKTLHRPFLDPLHHQNTRSSLLWSWGSVWTYRAQHCQWRQREREKLSEIPELSGIWKPPSDRSLAKLEPRVMEMFTFLSTLGAAWHSPSNYVSNKEIERQRVCSV